MRPNHQSSTSSTPGTAFALPSQQVAFFKTFGFVVLRGLFADEITTIQAGFEEVFARDEAETLDPTNEFHRTRDSRYESETRWIIPSVVDKSDKLRWLRDDDRVDAIARGLLGDNYVYAESDGNLFNCDVYWHLDAYGAFAEHQHIKLFFYLDPLTHDAGALRVIPGSHNAGSYTKALRRQLTKEPGRVPEIFGTAVDQIPSWTVESTPGDVIVGDFRTLHASFNGNVRRRLFTVNFGARSDATT